MNATIKMDKPVLQQIFTYLRKVSDDAIIVVGRTGHDNFFSIRALNSSRSTLPIITFKSSFFSEFVFDDEVLNDNNPQIVAQISTTALITAFKNAKSPSRISFRIEIAPPPSHISSSEDDNSKHPYDKTFIISIVDQFEINHIWEFPMSPSQVINALFDSDEYLAELKCRVDIFDGLADAFQNQNTIYLEVNTNTTYQDKETGLLVFKSTQSLISDDTTDSITSLSSLSSLVFYKSDKCELVSFDQDEAARSGRIQISFFLFDFIIGLKIAKILNQFVTIRILGSGQPLVLKSHTPGVIDFNMPISTFNENEDEDEMENEPENDETLSELKGTGVDTYSRDDLDNSTQISQVAPWQFNDSRPSVKPEPLSDVKTVQFDSSQSVLGSYNDFRKSSQMRASSLYQESPPWPPRRRITGSDQVAQASQPQSDEEDESD